MALTLTGKVIAVLQPTSGVSQTTGKAWMKNDYVIEIPDQYPKKMVFTVFGEDRIKQFNIKMGEDITVHFDIDAREWQGKWFNDVRAFSVTRQQQDAQEAAPQPQQAAPQPQTFEEPDPLPF